MPFAEGVRLAGLGDEAAPDLAGQIGAVAELGWNRLELRTIDGTPIAGLTEHAFREAAEHLEAAGTSVVGIASKIGDWSRPVTGDFAADVRELDVLARRCAVLGTRLVRVMSYPNDGLDEPEWGRRARERLRELARRAEDHGLVLAHENCAGWAADRADRMLDLVTGSPALRLLFDIGNGVAHGYPPLPMLRDIVPHVVHVHVKDARADTRGEVTFVPPGEGEAQVAECLDVLFQAGYDGVLSIEPHVRLQPHLNSGTGDQNAFVACGRALEHLLTRTALRLPAPLTPADRDLLLHLLDLPTAGPLETGPLETGPDTPPPRLAEAQHAYARHAAAIGLHVVRHAPADPADLDSDLVPAPVREAMADPRFLTDQPSLVLRLGPDDLPAARTVMFNVHLDTVAGLQPARFDGERFHGRGAIDAKGPAVALLAGIRAACARRPALGRDIGVLVQAVAGEEGGAMGVFGTRPLVRRGFTGRLNVFCEPTRGRFLTRSTAAMTARIVVDGADAVDDRPEAGHNATVLLGFLAQHLGRALDSSETAICVAGLHTGTQHNKVYGTGSLLLNLGYASPASAHRLEQRLQDALDEGLEQFATLFADTALFSRTAADARTITRLEWRKHGLPVLDDRDEWGHALLRDHAEIPPWPAAEPAFTCDAIWMSQVPDACTVVLGPGDLAANNAHAPGEFATATELAAFATTVSLLLTAFTDTLKPTHRPTTPQNLEPPAPAPPPRIP